MNTVRIFAATFVSVALLLATAAAAEPQGEAIAKYREYVAAIRDGEAENVIMLVEPVPETSKPLLTASVKSKIAMEAVKTEMTSQMGPPTLDEPAWNLGQLSDELLNRLETVAWDENTIGLMVKDPQVSAGWVVRLDGQWVIPAALVMDLSPTAQFMEPAKEEREQMLKYAQATTTAAEALLKRLREMEFKTPAEVQNALGDEMNKAAAP